MNNKIAQNYTFCLQLLLLLSSVLNGVKNTNASDDEEEIIVETTHGKVAGSVLTSRDGKPYYAFKGIPFGLIVKRFEPAIFAKPWEGIRDAKEFGPVCPQFDRATQKVIGDEQLCLVLNIFTPEIQELSEKLPVIVWVHGGAYQFGSGNDYGGAYFTDEKIVLVTFNYRLGSLGFLSTGDEVVQGNAGLKDQNLALKWVQQNIEKFGGDKDRITLSGTSAGGSSVSFHILSPMSSGLFQRAETTSGSPLNPWSLHPNPRKIAHDLAEILDCPTEPSSALAECLRKTDFRKIVQTRMSKWHVDPLCQFAPVVEKLRSRQSSSDVMLSEDPLTLLKEGRFNKVPIMMGVMKDEGLLFHSAGILKNPELQKNMNENWNYVAPITLSYDMTLGVSQQQLTDVSRTIRGYYFGQKIIGPETATNLTNLYSDRYFNHGIKKAALLQAKFTPVYAFILGFQGDWSVLNLYYGDAYKEPIGVSHGDDMQYLFDSPRFPPIKEGSLSEQFSRQMVKLFASFARTGNMMDSVGTSKTPWLPVSPEEMKRNRIKWYYMDLQPKVIIREPFTERLDFWDKIETQLESLRVKALTIPEEDDSNLKDEL